MALKKAPAGKPRSAKLRSAKPRRAPTWAQLAARGKGARKVPIVINRLPKELLNIIKKDKVVRLKDWGYAYHPAFGVIERYYYVPETGQLKSKLFFDAKTGKILSPEAAINRFRRA